MESGTASKKEDTVAALNWDTSEKPPHMRINDDMCYESYPCKHRVSLDDGETWFLMDGVQIYNYCRLSGQDIDTHFECYKNWDGSFK